LLFSSILVQHGHHFNYWNQPLNMCMCLLPRLSWSRTVLLPSDTYTESFFNFVDLFTALHFMVTGASPAARCIWILLMNQHAWWLITFGKKRNN
jgi:hypothetical protein